jgi:hypothetical protein
LGVSTLAPQAGAQPPCVRTKPTRGWPDSAIARTDGRACPCRLELCRLYRGGSRPTRPPRCTRFFAIRRSNSCGTGGVCARPTVLPSSLPRTCRSSPRNAPPRFPAGVILSPVKPMDFLWSNDGSSRQLRGVWGEGANPGRASVFSSPEKRPAEFRCACTVPRNSAPTAKSRRCPANEVKLSHLSSSPPLARGGPCDLGVQEVPSSNPGGPTKAFKGLPSPELPRPTVRSPTGVQTRRLPFGHPWAGCGFDAAHDWSPAQVHHPAASAPRRRGTTSTVVLHGLEKLLSSSPVSRNGAEKGNAGTTARVRSGDMVFQTDCDVNSKLGSKVKPCPHGNQTPNGSQTGFKPELTLELQLRQTRRVT